MQPIIRLSLIALLGAFLSACSETRTTRCQPERLLPGYVGYSVDELDSVYLMRYQAGSGFSTLLDYFLHQSDAAGFLASGDTLRTKYYMDHVVMEPGYDYELRIPAQNRTYRITEIQSEGQEFMTYKVPLFSKVDMSPCINSLVSFRIDGQLVERSKPEYEPLEVFILR